MRKDYNIPNPDVATEARILTAKMINVVSETMADKTDRFKFRSHILLDSGASHTMVSDVGYLQNVRKISPKPVVLGNGSTLHSEKQGDAVLQAEITSNGVTLTRCIWMFNVLYVPALESDLISVSNLCQEDFDVRFSPKTNICQAMRKCLSLLQGYLNGGLYYVNGNRIRHENIDSKSDLDVAKEEEGVHMRVAM